MTTRCQGGGVPGLMFGGGAQGKGDRGGDDCDVPTPLSRMTDRHL